MYNKYLLYYLNKLMSINIKKKSNLIAVVKKNCRKKIGDTLI